MKKILWGFIVLSAFSAFIQPAMADHDPVLGDNGQPGSATQRLLGIINRVINLMMGLLIALAVIFIIYAGYLYLTAAGEGEQYETAKRIIWYAAIAIAVALLSKGIVFIVGELVGADLGNVL